MSLLITESIEIQENYPELEPLIKNEALVDEKLQTPDVEKTKCGEIFAFNSGNFILICGFCGGEHENIRLFGEHIQQKHPDGIFQTKIHGMVTPYDSISICARIEKAELDISADEYSSDESNYSRCKEEKGQEELSEINSSESEDNEHQKTQIAQVIDAIFSCDLCGRSYSLKKSLQRHQRVGCKMNTTEPTGDPDLFCRVCCKQIKTRQSFMRHQRSVHHGKTLKTETAETEKNDTSLFCELCKKCFKSKFNFEYHVKRAHDNVLPPALQNDPDFLKCKFCHKQFSDFPKKAQHELIHSTEERPYICLQCPSTFVQNTQLTKHLRKHSDVRNFSCEFCNQAFKTKTVLKIHMSRHTGNRPFVCEECGLTFVIETQLNYHRKRHKGQKEFWCDVCHKGFYSMFTLKEHQIGHTGEQPFSCDVCGRKFSRLRAYNKHMKLHSGVKDYVCNICGKAYAQDSGLYAHRKSHFK